MSGTVLIVVYKTWQSKENEVEKGAEDLDEVVNEVVSEAKSGNRGGSGNRGYTYG